MKALMYLVILGALGYGFFICMRIIILTASWRASATPRNEPQILLPIRLSKKCNL